MKRLGWEKKNTDQIIPYRYMIRSYKNDEYICGVSNDNVKLTGFNNNNDLTTRATKTNTGQITEYPFKIDETLKIASTHGQWYQLDMEDPKLRSGTVFRIMRTEIRVHGRVRLQTEMEPVPPMGLPE